MDSIPGRVIPKTQKMVLDASLLNTQHYKVRIKSKVEPSREGVAPSPTSWCSSYRKGSLRVTLGYGRQLYFLLIYTYIYIYIYISICLSFWLPVSLSIYVCVNSYLLVHAYNILVQIQKRVILARHSGKNECSNLFENKCKLAKICEWLVRSKNQLICV